MMSFAAIKERFRQILHLGDSPRRTATAFAIGAFIAFTPTYGLHFLSAALCAWLLRLNALALIAGTLINNPWTVLPIIGASMWLGLLIDPVGPMPDINWTDFTSHMLWDQFQILWNQFRPYLGPFVWGHLLLGTVAAALGYGVLYQAILRYRNNLAPPPPSC